jgi:hypothetical protein
MRRNTTLKNDQTRFQDQFSKQQGLWENFATENPDEVARDLEALLGPPPTRDYAPM